MKYLIILFTIILAFESSFSQTLTQDEKENILEALNDSSMNYRGAALSAIIKYKITEAKDSLEKRYGKIKEVCK